MTDTIPPMTPMRPFLLKGVLEWILNNDMTPHIIVDATMPRVEVPPQSIKDDQVVLNISPSAVSGWEVNDDFIRFQTRFNNEATWVWLPMNAIIAIYSRESGRGMEFPAEIFPMAIEAEINTPSTTVKKRSHLRIVK